MLIKKSDVKQHMAARRAARHLQLLSKLPATATATQPLQPMPASGKRENREPIRLVPRVGLPAVEKPVTVGVTTTVFKPSQW
jgi:hypothetical protein